MKKCLKRAIALMSFLPTFLLASGQALDPGVPGTQSFDTAAYDLGTFQPSNFSSPVELRGFVYFPTGTTSPSPLVLIMHGRHSSCYDDNNTVQLFSDNTFTYPCASTFPNEIPNYRGYDYLGEHLASQGYTVVSISANGIWSVAGNFDFGMLGGSELITEHLDRWKNFNTAGGVPFGNQFVGKIDLSKIITIGHSRGGEAVVKQFNMNKNAMTPYSIKGVLSIAGTNFERLAVSDMNHAAIVGFCDGDLSDIPSIWYYDDSRYLSNFDAGARHVVALKGANHNFFNTIWTPDGFQAGTEDDWTKIDPDLADPLCGSNSSGRFSPEKQRQATKTYVSAFVKTYADGDVEYSDALTGVNKTPPASSGLLTKDVSISYHAPSNKRLDLNKVNIAPNLFINSIGGSVSTQGFSSVNFCGDSNASFICGPSKTYDSHYHDIDNFLGIPRPLNGLTRIQLKWSTLGAKLQNNIPVFAQNLSGFTHLSFRALAPQYPEATPINVGTQNFSVVLTDAYGNSASLEAATYSTALDQSNGKTRFHNLSTSILLPLQEFSGVNLSQIANVKLIFDKLPKGEIHVSDFSFIELECVPGLACSDGDPCTTGETYDANCNCTGGTPNTVDSDGDGVCDLADVCSGGNDNLDSDNDGIPNTCDVCPNAFTNDTDNDGVCDDVDICVGNDNLDTDGDGLPDACDPCPNDNQNSCTPSYCSVNGGLNLFVYIKRVLFQEIDVNTTRDFGYIDKTFVTANVIQGSTHPISLTANIEPNSVPYDPFWVVWIDFNQNGLFTEPGEQVFIGSTTSLANISGNISIPMNAKTGATRMRIALTDGVFPKPCGEFRNGEVEDYTVNVVAFGTCADNDNDNVCNANDICSLGDDAIDSDNDGTPDACDGCPQDPNNQCNSTYCASNGTLTSITHIQRIEFQEVNNFSGNNNGYQDFTNNPPITVFTGNSHQITLVPNINESGFAYTPTWSAWIDFNQDGNFNGPNEQILNNVTNGDDPLTASISIPANLTLIGNTRMRVVMTDGLTLPAPCGVYNAGETEDYLVRVVTTSPYCPSLGQFRGVTHIDQVEFEEINRASGNDNGYVNATNLVATVIAGQNHPITLTPNINAALFAYTPHWTVWIDLNNDNDFLDANEKVIDNVANGTSPLTTNIAIPAGQSFFGSTRMRITMTAGTPPQPCEQYNSGETEDYTVMITSGTCPDADSDGVCDSNDVCPNGNDMIDTDNDGIPDACDYCASTPNTQYEHIKLVQIGTINNASAASSSGYEDFTHLSTTLAGSATITIKPHRDRPTDSDGFAVWIDFNRDGSFASSEQVFSHAPSSDTVVTGTITIPSSALAGTTRMRVSMKYNALPTACMTTAYGEVEDYRVNIVPNVSSRINTDLSQNTVANSSPVHSSLRLFPNPVRNQSPQLVLDDASVDQFTVTVLNTNGSVIYQREVSGTHQCKLHMGEIATGIYLVKVQYGGKIETKRLVVLN